MTPNLLTIAEAAAKSGIPASTLGRWIRLGKLPAFRPSPRLFLIDAAELDKCQRPKRGNPNWTSNSPPLMS